MADALNEPGPVTLTARPFGFDGRRYACLTGPNGREEKGGTPQENPKEEERVELTHVTSLRKAELILDFGWYGGIAAPGSAGNFCKESGRFPVSDACHTWNRLIPRGDEGQCNQVVLSFDVPKSWINSWPLFEEMIDLNEQSRVAAVPAALMDILKRERIKVSSNEEFDLSEKLWALELGFELGHIPPWRINLEKTLACNIAIHGEKFKAASFGNMLLQRISRKVPGRGNPRDEVPRGLYGTFTLAQVEAIYRGLPARRKYMITDISGVNQFVREEFPYKLRDMIWRRYGRGLLLRIDRVEVLDVDEKDNFGSIIMEIGGQEVLLITRQLLPGFTQQDLAHEVIEYCLAYRQDAHALARKLADSYVFKKGDVFDSAIFGMGQDALEPFPAETDKPMDFSQRIISWQRAKRFPFEIKQILQRHGGRAGFLVHIGGQYLIDASHVFEEASPGTDIYLSNLKQFLTEETGLVICLGGDLNAFQDVKTKAVIIHIPSEERVSLSPMEGNPIPHFVSGPYLTGGDWSQWDPVLEQMKAWGIMILDPFGGEQAILDGNGFVGIRKAGCGCVGGALWVLVKHFPVHVLTRICCQAKANPHLLNNGHVDAKSYWIEQGKTRLDGQAPLDQRRDPKRGLYGTHTLGQVRDIRKQAIEEGRMQEIGDISGVNAFLEKFPKALSRGICKEYSGRSPPEKIDRIEVLDVEEKDNFGSVLMDIDGQIVLLVARQLLPGFTAQDLAHEVIEYCLDYRRDAHPLAVALSSRPAFDDVDAIFSAESCYQDALQHAWCKNTYVLNAKTKEPVQARTVFDVSGRMARYLKIIPVDLEVLVNNQWVKEKGHCSLHRPGIPEDLKTRVNGLGTDELSEYGREVDREYQYIGTRMMQASARLSRMLLVSWGYMYSRTNPADIDQQHFYEFLAQFGLVRNPVIGNYLIWELPVPNLPGFIEGIDGYIRGRIKPRAPRVLGLEFSQREAWARVLTPKGSEPEEKEPGKWERKRGSGFFRTKEKQKKTVDLQDVRDFIHERALAEERENTNKDGTRKPFHEVLKRHGEFVFDVFFGVWRKIEKDDINALEDLNKKTTAAYEEVYWNIYGQVLAETLDEDKARKAALEPAIVAAAKVHEQYNREFLESEIPFLVPESKWTEAGMYLLLANCQQEGIDIQDRSVNLSPDTVIKAAEEHIGHVPRNLVDNFREIVKHTTGTTLRSMINGYEDIVNHLGRNDPMLVYRYARLKMVRDEARKNRGEAARTKNHVLESKSAALEKLAEDKMQNVIRDLPGSHILALAQKRLREKRDHARARRLVQRAFAEAKRKLRDETLCCPRRNSRRMRQLADLLEFGVYSYKEFKAQLLVEAEIKRQLMAYARPATPYQARTLRRIQRFLRKEFKAWGIHYQPSQIIHVPRHIFNQYFTNHSKSLEVGGESFLCLNTVFLPAIRGRENIFYYFHEDIHQNVFGFAPRTLDEGMTTYLELLLLLKWQKRKVTPRALQNLMFRKRKGYSGQFTGIAWLIELLGLPAMLRAFVHGDYRRIYRLIGKEKWLELERWAAQFDRQNMYFGSKQGKRNEKKFKDGINRILHDYIYATRIGPLLRKNCQVAVEHKVTGESRDMIARRYWDKRGYGGVRRYANSKDKYAVIMLKLALADMRARFGRRMEIYKEKDTKSQGQSGATQSLPAGDTSHEKNDLDEVFYARVKSKDRDVWIKYEISPLPEAPDIVNYHASIVKSPPENIRQVRNIKRFISRIGKKTCVGAKRAKRYRKNTSKAAEPAVGINANVSIPAYGDFRDREEAILSRLVAENRAYLVKVVLGAGSDQSKLTATALEGKCDTCLTDILRRLYLLRKSSGLDFTVTTHQATQLFTSGSLPGSLPHLFMVITFNDTKNSYLVDPAFIQFFNPQEEEYIGYPGWFLQQIGKTAWARQLLLQGYIELDDEAASVYATALFGNRIPDGRFLPIKAEHYLQGSTNEAPCFPADDEGFKGLGGDPFSVDPSVHPLEKWVAEVVRNAIPGHSDGLSKPREDRRIGQGAEAIDRREDDFWRWYSEFHGEQLLPASVQSGRRTMKVCDGLSNEALVLLYTAGIEPGGRILILGSNDGRLGAKISYVFKTQVTGVEDNPALALESKFYASWAEQMFRTTLIFEHGNCTEYLQSRISEYDVIYSCVSDSKEQEGIAGIILNQLRPGQKFIVPGTGCCPGLARLEEHLSCTKIMKNGRLLGSVYYRGKDGQRRQSVKVLAGAKGLRVRTETKKTGDEKIGDSPHSSGELSQSAKSGLKLRCSGGLFLFAMVMIQEYLAKTGAIGLPHLGLIKAGLPRLIKAGLPRLIKAGLPGGWVVAVVILSIILLAILITSCIKRKALYQNFGKLTKIISGLLCSRITEPWARVKASLPVGLVMTDKGNSSSKETGPLDTAARSRHWYAGIFAPQTEQDRFLIFLTLTLVVSILLLVSYQFWFPRYAVFYQAHKFIASGLTAAILGAVSELSGDYIKSGSDLSTLVRALKFTAIVLFIYFPVAGSAALMDIGLEWLFPAAGSSQIAFTLKMLVSLIQGVFFSSCIQYYAPMLSCRLEATLRGLQEKERNKFLEDYTPEKQWQRVKTAIKLRLAVVMVQHDLIQNICPSFVAKIFTRYTIGFAVNTFRNWVGYHKKTSINAFWFAVAGLAASLISFIWGTPLVGIMAVVFSLIILGQDHVANMKDDDVNGGSDGGKSNTKFGSRFWARLLASPRVRLPRPNPDKSGFGTVAGMAPGNKPAGEQKAAERKSSELASTGDGLSLPLLLAYLRKQVSKPGGVTKEVHIPFPFHFPKVSVCVPLLSLALWLKNKFMAIPITRIVKTLGDWLRDLAWEIWRKIKFMFVPTERPAPVIDIRDSENMTILERIRDFFYELWQSLYALFKQIEQQLNKWMPVPAVVSINGPEVDTRIVMQMIQEPAQQPHIPPDRLQPESVTPGASFVVSSFTATWAALALQDPKKAPEIIQRQADHLKKYIQYSKTIEIEADTPQVETKARRALSELVYLEKQKQNQTVADLAKAALDGLVNRGK